MKLSCPKCGTTGDILLFVEAEQTRQTLRKLFAATPVGLLVLRYVELHRPLHNAMNPARWNRLAVEVHELIEAGSLPYQGKAIPAGLAAWQYAVEEAYRQKEAGTLTLPLSGHGWVTSVIARYAPPAPVPGAALAAAPATVPEQSPSPTQPRPVVGDTRPRWEQK